MKIISTPRDLLVEELKDLYSAETQLVTALSEMAQTADNEELRYAFTSHLGQTKGHVERLDEIGRQLGQSMTGKTCKAMAGLIADRVDLMDEDTEPAMLDFALIGAAQKVEHYEIAGYGTTRTLAELAGETAVAAILQETLDEEGAANKLLTEIAAKLEFDNSDEEETEAVATD